MRTALVTLGGFGLGFVAVYAVAMVLAFLGLPTNASLPYEQLLGWMMVGRASAAVLQLVVLRGALRRGG